MNPWRDPSSGYRAALYAVAPAAERTSVSVHRSRYFTLKKELEAQFKHDRVSYTNGKADFNSAIIDKARQDSEWVRLLDIGVE